MEPSSDGSIVFLCRREGGFGRGSWRNGHVGEDADMNEGEGTSFIEIKVGVAEGGRR